MDSKRKNTVTAVELALERLEEEVIRDMNERPEAREVARVATIVMLLERLNEDATTRTRMEALIALRRNLGAYQWVSYVTPSTDGLVVLNEIWDRARISADSRWEHEAVRDLLAALPSLGVGKRLLIRRCEACREWFIAARSDKRTCKAACRVWLYDQSPEQRERKAAKMREARKDEKDRKGRQDLAAIRSGFTKSKRHIVTKSRGRKSR